MQMTRKLKACNEKKNHMDENVNKNRKTSNPSFFKIFNDIQIVALDFHQMLIAHQMVLWCWQAGVGGGGGLMGGSR